MEYVVGIIFNENQSKVLLIRKNRPEFLKNKFNGIGGKVEKGESPLQTMIRESQEETTVKDTNWVELGILSDPVFKITFFALYNQNLDHIQALTDEKVYVMDVRNVFDPFNYLAPDIVVHLRPFIALAMDTAGLELPVTFFNKQG